MKTVDEVIDEFGDIHDRIAVSDGEMKKVFVAVYGTLMSGERNARWAMGAKRRPAWIHGRIYDTGWGYPAFVWGFGGSEDRVEAELLETDEEGLRSMDRLEGYPELYDRITIPVYHDGSDDVDMAWVYVMNRLPKKAKLIKCGDWRVYRKGVAD